MSHADERGVSDDERLSIPRGVSSSGGLLPFVVSRRLRWAAVGIWMGLIFLMSAQQSLPSLPDGTFDFLSKKAAHFGTYAVLSSLIWWAIAPARLAYPLAWALATLYALSDEWHQSFVPGRSPSLRDVLIDAAGAATALLIMWLLRRRRDSPLQERPDAV